MASNGTAYDWRRVVVALECQREQERCHEGEEIMK